MIKKSKLLANITPGEILEEDFPAAGSVFQDVGAVLVEPLIPG